MARRPSTPVEDVQPATPEGRRDLPLVALRETVIFPEMIVPLQVGREKSVNALNAAVAEGGPIALAHTGARIRIDIPARSMNVLLDPAELERRRAAWVKPKAKISKGWLGRYARLVTSANKGAVLALPEEPG